MASTASLAQISQRFRASLDERLATLEAALQGLRHPNPNPQAAREETHRLAGGLGTFGDQEGSAQAQQMEQLLSQEPPSARLS